MLVILFFFYLPLFFFPACYLFPFFRKTERDTKARAVFDASGVLKAGLRLIDPTAIF